MKQDYYDGLIQERGAKAAAPLLADECRKADIEITILKARLESVYSTCECSGNEKEESKLITLLAAIDELERAAEDCGYYCEPPDDADNPRLAYARRRRDKANQRIKEWIKINKSIHKNGAGSANNELS